jgi:hypothetical protein
MIVDLKPVKRPKKYCELTERIFLEQIAARLSVPFVILKMV